MRNNVDILRCVTFLETWNSNGTKRVTYQMISYGMPVLNNSGHMLVVQNKAKRMER